MAKHVNTAGSTRKSHKSRKTTAQKPGKPDIPVMSEGGPSSAPLTTAEPSAPIPLQNPLALALRNRLAKDDKASAEPGRTTEIISPEPKKQWWYREPDSKTRKLAEKVVVMRAAGRQDAEIAKRLKTTAPTIRQAVYVARKNGWLDDNDEPVDLEVELAMDVDRKVVRNVSASLDGQMTNWQTHEMTIAAAKGRGIFKADAGKAVDASMPMVAIQVIMPPVGADDQRVREDEMGGVPAYIEAETLEG